MHKVANDHRALMEQNTKNNDSLFFVCDGLSGRVFCEDVIYTVIVRPLLFEFNALACSYKRADL